MSVSFLATANGEDIVWRLVKYLEENGPALAASVKEDHAELAEKLAEIWPGGGKVEKGHFALAGAVVAALWLGRQAQLDKEAGDRSAEQFFREAIATAFETGKQSAMTSP
ncbi:MAG: hypothetical protein ACREAY_00830 [Nitrososphaera sp.]|uniref:hypothetical protein n=1 Tax=Nitrososphaera sp. TaxID=1971748 RepID=UPI003D6DF45E